MASEHTRTPYKHIELDEKGVPLIAGTTMKVIELALSHTAYGWNAEQLLRNYPHLTLAKIHSALAYYFDHKVELDADIQRRREWAEAMRLAQADSPLAERLRRFKAAQADNP
ncbi:DUF433 domain-containing protein [Gloeobacter morelensis]|uniref:DUF433 domain-containing protein n=1 Tax=Gloeobacter morelensis MG652769 TaxID=2781736 RepID=A0ABY3PMR4_9CYAN|nr:DUF433 domain-containing protein [Gloeobacter morelensis]UFP94988.1 DUF433 domain-containing protein [Gloeobacter morelensis MG652769]